MNPASPVTTCSIRRSRSFAIASSNIDEKRAEEILRTLFPRYRGAEFKFSNIWGSNHRGGLVTFARYLHEFEGWSFIYMADKRFDHHRG
jgi:hypothetical protein